jgi:hypothetical protein
MGTTLLAAGAWAPAATIYALGNGNWDSDIWSTDGSTVVNGLRPGHLASDLPYTTGTANRAITLDSPAIGTVSGWSSKSNGGLLTIEHGAVLNWTSVYDNAVGFSATVPLVTGTAMTGGTLSGSVLKVARVANNAAVTGTFDQSGGAVTVSLLRLTEVTSGTGTPTGTYSLSNTGQLNITGDLDPGTNPTGAIFSFTGGTLNHNGLLMNLTNDGGTLAPGGVGAVGTALLKGSGSAVGRDYTQNSGILAIDIASGGFDQLLGTDSTSGSNNVILNGTLQVNLLGGFTPADGATFDIVTTGDLADSSITDNTTLLASGLGSGFFTKSIVSAGNVDVLRLTYSSVPEPGTASLLSIGGLWLLRRRRAR